MNCAVARVNILVVEIPNGWGGRMRGLSGQGTERCHRNVACVAVDKIGEFVVGRKIVPASSRPA